MLVWMVHGRVAGDTKLGTPVLLLPPSYGRNNLFPRAIHPTCAHARMEAWLQRREAGNRELEFAGSVSIPALDAARSPGHLQVLCNCLESKR